MAQITTGIYSVLSHPAVYSLLQAIMGARRARTDFAARRIRPIPGMKILDIGCGPADILAYLPDVEYWGFDISEAYISQAKAVFQERGKFYCKQLDCDDLAKMPKFDLVLVSGVLHHLDDDNARYVMQLAAQALGPNGRLLTIDPCLDDSQNCLVRFLVCNDRGKNVRNKAAYEQLVNSFFPSIHIEVRHQFWIPYTHCIMECCN